MLAHVGLIINSFSLMLQFVMSDESCQSSDGVICIHIQKAMKYEGWGYWLVSKKWLAYWIREGYILCLLIQLYDNISLRLQILIKMSPKDH